MMVLKRVLEAFAAVVFSAAAFAVMALVSCDGAGESVRNVSVEIWYSPYSSADAPLPADWFGYKVIEEQLGIRVRAVPLPSRRDEQDALIEKAASSGTLPDLFMVSRDVLVRLVKADKVARVDSMFRLMPTRTRLMHDGAARLHGSFDGLTYGLSQPAGADRGEGILVRKDWLDRLGLPVPVTTDDFLNVMTAFTFGDPDGNGLDDTFGWGAFIDIADYEEGLGRRLAPFFGAFGVAGTFSASRETMGLNVHRPEYYDALDFVRKMVAAKVIDPNWTAYRKDDFRDAWKGGRFGMMREQNAAFALEANYAPFDERFPDGEWILVDPPRGPSGESSVGCYTRRYRTLAVSRRAAELGKVTAIATLLEWLSSDGYNLVCFGKEGVNFRIGEDGEVTAEGLPDPSQAYTQPDSAPLLQLRNLVFHGGDDELRSRYPSWRTRSGREMSALATLRDMQGRAWTPSVAIPAPPDGLRPFYEQGVLEFATGSRKLTPASWKEWLAEFDRRGGSAWEAECRGYVDSNRLYID